MMATLIGCGRNDKPVPEARFTVKSEGMMTPVGLTPELFDPNYKKTMLSAAASGEPPAARGPAVPVDQSTPESAVNTYIAISREMQLSQLPDILVPEQQETARTFATAAQPFLNVARELKQRLDERFPGHTINLGQMGGPGGQNWQPTYEVVRIDPVNGSETVA
jgi:hypothetical protein